MAKNRDADRPRRRRISLDIRVFNSQEAARLLAMHIQFELGHFADDDPYQPVGGKPRGGAFPETTDQPT